MKKYDILVVGGGGREHAIIKTLQKSEKAGKIYAAPGNGGIARDAECISVKATDIEGIVALAKEKKVDIVFVAPDDPLVMGLVDRLNEENIKAFGPSKAAARIEGSKVFSKNLMKKYNIPTAKYEVFDDPAKALEYVKKENSFPVVIKADGLALGKGVIIAEDLSAAEKALKEIMLDKMFGSSGDNVVIEEFLTGPEVSLLAFCDGKTLKPMVSAQDHKRALDGDKGLNTGGMGAFTPSPNYTEEVHKTCMETIFLPTVEAMKKEGCAFKGVLYFGLMITKDGPKVIEYNARFGDPETQVVLPRLKSDFIDIILAVIDEDLDDTDVIFDDEAAACIVLASGGYPQKYETGFELLGLENAEKEDATTVFYAGVKADGDKLLTGGGRVLAVSSKAETLEKAVLKAYKAASNITFKNMHFRTDIGKSFINK